MMKDKLQDGKELIKLVKDVNSRYDFYIPVKIRQTLL